VKFTPLVTPVSRGMSNKEVARSLKCTERAVKHHMTNIMQKLNVRNRFEAAMEFPRGLITVHGDFDSLTWFNGTDGWSIQACCEWRSETTQNMATRLGTTKIYDFY